MKISTLLKEYCDITNPEKTGLLLLDLPTGFGKTHETLKFIYDNYQKSDKKIVFLTELKKNLPHDTTLKKFFEEENRLEDFKKDVVFINSNVDCVLENLIPNEIIISDFIKESQEYRILKRNINDFQSLSKKKDETSNRLSERIKTEIQKENEPAFRQLISNLFYEKGKKKEERIVLLKDDKNFQWVAKVYPASLSFEKKIFFLSVDKFLVKNSPIIQKSHYFFDNDFLKNALIFIDEFDASKEVVLKNIIETQLKKRIDIIGLFEQIYSSFSSLTIPKIYYKNSQKWEKKKEKKTDLQDIAQIIDNLRNETIKINEAYNVSYSVKTYGLNHQRNFLFHDYQYHTIVGDKKNFIYLEQDKDEQVNKINFVEPDDKQFQKPSVTEFLTAIKGFINYFKGGAKLIAENYQQIKTENLNTEDFSFESALSSFFDELKLTKEQKDYLLDSIQVKQFQNKQKNQETETKNDFSFYNNGFRYYDFEDSEMHDTKSKIFVTDFDRTPEKLLLDLANNNLVVGISATAKMKTVIGNYDLKYLRKNLGDNFLELNTTEIQALKTEFAKRNENYVSVKAEFLGIDDWKKTLKNFAFDKVTTNELLTELEKYENAESQNFELKRYLKIAKVFQEFISNDNIQSFLCFLNTHPTDKEKSNCKLSVLEMLFVAIVQKHQKGSLFQNNKGELDIKKSFRVLNSKDFEDKKEEILETLKTGQKLFLMTTYATLGAGQNIQYALDNFDELLASGKFKQTYTPKGYTPEKLKDFDAIYLDKPSNLLVNINAEELNDFDVNKRIFQVEMLLEGRQIFPEQVTYEIKDTFKKAYHKDRHIPNFRPSTYKNPYETEDFRNYVAKEVIQAIGRINRTHFKNSEVYIFADKEIAPHIKFFDRLNYLCLREFDKLIDEAQFFEAEEIENDEMKIDIAINNQNCHSWINAKVKGKYWNEQNIRDWQELREIVLKYPTVSKREFETLTDLRNWQFIYVPILDADFKDFEPKNRYHFTQENDYSTVRIDFSGNGKEISAQVIHLPEQMQIAELKNLFEMQGYATDFQVNDYIIASEIFNNIYKGALGEVIGKYIFEKYVLPEKELQELPSEIFERFDFILDNGIFIDFKFWNEENSQEQQIQIDKIFGLKVPDIQQKGFEFSKVFIVNILADSRFPIRTSQNGQLIEVPYLIDSNSFTIAENIIFELRNLLSTK
ncbi:MAG: hypothetical protein MUF43_05360 [Flavobacterium sp.]|nr:hypothetical protein [Flavobacterium sp.]MCU0392194.1 hypothetical protein [Thermoflexibacter sp.]